MEIVTIEELERALNERIEKYGEVIAMTGPWKYAYSALAHMRAAEIYAEMLDPSAADIQYTAYSDRTAKDIYAAFMHGEMGK